MKRWAWMGVWVLASFGAVRFAEAEGWIVYNYYMTNDLLNFKLNNPAWGLYVMPDEPTGGAAQIAQGMFKYPEVSADGSTLLFVAPHISLGITEGLYAMSAQGGAARVLSSPMGWISYPSLSPDKTRAVYCVYIPPGGGGDDEPTKTPTPFGGFRAAAAPAMPSSSLPAPNLNPRAILPSQTDPFPPFASSNPYAAIARLDGSDSGLPWHRPIPGQDTLSAIWTSPDWHPFDNNRVLMSIWNSYMVPASDPRLPGTFGPAIYEISPDLTQVKPLLYPQQSLNFIDGYGQPVWSPDGQWIAYVFSRLDINTFVGNSAIYIMRADGSDAPGRQASPVFQTAGDGINKITWSPDGQWLAFSMALQAESTGNPISGFQHHYDIHKIRADGTGLTRLTNNGASVNPVWIGQQQLPDNIPVPGQQPVQSTPTPSAPGTPVPGAGVDLRVNRIFMVAEDGTESFDDDPVVQNPQPGQQIRFRADIENLGPGTINGYQVALYVDGQPLFEPFDFNEPFAPGPDRWRSGVWTAEQPGTHTFEWRFIVQGDANPLDNAMATQFQVGSESPLATPTPGGGAFDMAVNRVFMVIDDGGGDFEDDVEVQNPQSGQVIRFRAEIENRGPAAAPAYRIELWIDGELFNSGERNEPFPPGPFSWRSLEWRADVSGPHAFEWRIIAEGDSNPANNSMSASFNVGQVQPPATPTPAFPRTPTPMPALTPTPPVPIPTPVFPPGPTAAPAPGRVYHFEGFSLADNGWAEIPGGFLGQQPGTVRTAAFFGNPIPSSADKRGLEISVTAGQTAFVYARETVRTNGSPVLLRMSLRADGANASVALVALKGNLGAQALDGSIAYKIPSNSSSFVDSEQQMVILYEPDSGDEFTPAIQVAAKDQPGAVTVLIDRLEIIRLEPGTLHTGSQFYSQP